MRDSSDSFGDRLFAARLERREAETRLRLASIDQRAGLYDDALAHCALGIESAGDDLPGLRSSLEAAAGLTCCYQDEYQHALTWVRCGFERLPHVADDRERAGVEVLLQRTLGNALLGLDRRRPAIEAFERGLALSEALDDPWERSIGLYNLGEAHATARNWSTARSYLEESRREKVVLGDHWGLAHVNHGVARVTRGECDPNAALAELEAGLLLARGVGDPRLARMLASARRELLDARGSDSRGLWSTDPVDCAMSRYADGDRDAFRIVHDALGPILVSYARRWTRNSARADDAVQQTFLQLHRARQTFVRGAPASPWVFSILKRVLIDGHRKQERLDATTRLTDVPDARRSITPHDEYSAIEVADRLSLALEKMPNRQREAFSMVRGAGQSFEEAAMSIGTTALAVKLRVHRATQALRSALDEEV